jgi:hypothetical protein
MGICRGAGGENWKSRSNIANITDGGPTTPAHLTSSVFRRVALQGAGVKAQDPKGKGVKAQDPNGNCAQ